MDLWCWGPSWIQTSKVKIATQPEMLQQTTELKTPISAQEKDSYVIENNSGQFCTRCGEIQEFSWYY